MQGVAILAPAALLMCGLLYAEHLGRPRLILEREDIFLRVLIEHWDLDPTQLCPVGRS